MPIPIRGNGYSPPRPEFRPLWGGFAELRGVIRARRVPDSIAHPESREVDPRSLRRAADRSDDARDLDQP